MEEESLWLVRSKAGSHSHNHRQQQQQQNNKHLYTEEMQQQQQQINSRTSSPSRITDSATVNVNNLNQDNCNEIEDDIVDNTASLLLAQFHEDAIKQVIKKKTFLH